MRSLQEELVYRAKLELAKRDFWEYCKIISPYFYKEGRDYLKTFCHELQEFYESKEKDLIVCMPPRHGKSFTLIHFETWVLGKNPNEKIMTCSYNEVLSTTFSRSVRGIIQNKKVTESVTVFNEIFPDVHIKYGEGASNLWSLEKHYSNYLSTSPKGTATGFGASLMVVDDLIKSYEDSINENLKDSNWNWFNNTMSSRLESGGKTIIVMTRWASDDLAGRLLNYYNEVKKPVRYITKKALQDDGTMLCDDVLTKEDYLDKVQKMSKTEDGAAIASANYQQIPIDIKGRLYQTFQTYTRLPRDNEGRIMFEQICCYIDTADEGEDYFCAINYGVLNKQAYILDVLYTKEGMEITEPKTAEMLVRQGVNVCYIESNNGGRGFSRAIKKIMAEQYQTNKCVIKSFHQSQNKMGRILSNATWIMENVFFPANWSTKYPEYFNAMFSYQREGKNKHDDAPDATTGVAERVFRGNNFTFD